MVEEDEEESLSINSAVVRHLVAKSLCFFTPSVLSESSNLGGSKSLKSCEKSSIDSISPSPNIMFPVFGLADDDDVGGGGVVVCGDGDVDVVEVVVAAVVVVVVDMEVVLVTAMGIESEFVVVDVVEDALLLLVLLFLALVLIVQTGIASFVSAHSVESPAVKKQQLSVVSSFTSWMESSLETSHIIFPFFSFLLSFQLLKRI